MGTALDFEKVKSSTDKIKSEMDRIAREKEALEDNLLMKRHDIEKLEKGNAEKKRDLEEISM